MHFEGLFAMHYVYILKSLYTPDRKYTGHTSDLKRRLSCHNQGKVIATGKDRPWIIKMYFAFSDKDKALAFEKYLKSGSGKAFAQRHF